MNKNIRWVDQIGHALIKRTSFSIGGEEVYNSGEEKMEKYIDKWCENHNMRLSKILMDLLQWNIIWSEEVEDLFIEKIAYEWGCSLQMVKEYYIDKCMKNHIFNNLQLHGCHNIGYKYHYLKK